MNSLGTINTNSITSGCETYLIAKPSTTNIIACFKEKPKGGGLIYDASFVAQSIKNKYGIY